VQYHAQTKMCNALLMRPSNQVSEGACVLSPEQTKEVAAALTTVQEHFQRLYEPAKTPRSGPGALPPMPMGPGRGFAIEVEFKFTKEGKLVIKQARPWVE
jgi:hypothetical protein